MVQEIIINKHPIRKRMTDKELEVSLMNEIVSYTDKINDLFKYFDKYIIVTIRIFSILFVPNYQ
jgi:hypothetical protein